MAILKHIKSKNARYSDAEKYLLFEHDEFTMKPILDENGRLIPRQDYRVATLNCGEEDFTIACIRANLKYKKNRTRADIKSHHYIISFDPRDREENGLTVDRAQELGAQFCKDHFPGHQAIVCTHPDGHNGTGNIHVHIVINSLRIEDVPRLPYMDRPADTKAGMKHRCTDAAMEYFKAEVMEMCHREGLYQIDLLNGSEERVTDREYWAQKQGQAALDKENAALAAEGKPIKQTKYETDKEKLRKSIRKALETATTFDEFVDLLSREGVSVKESRGRLSYLTSERAKPIRARKLGDAFDLAAVNEALAQSATRKQPDRPSVLDKLKDPKGIERMVDVQAKRKEGKGIGYLQWANIHNIHQMAATWNLYTENKWSRDEVDELVSAARQELQDSRAKIKALESVIDGKKELRTHLANYWHTKTVRQEYKAIKSEKKRAAYYQEHESELLLSKTAVKFFKEHGIHPLPKMKSLQAEIQQLISEKNALYEDYRDKKKRVDELMTVRHNLDQMLGKRSEKEKQYDLVEI